MEQEAAGLDSHEDVLNKNLDVLEIRRIYEQIHQIKGDLELPEQLTAAVGGIAIDDGGLVGSVRVGDRQVRLEQLGCDSGIAAVAGRAGRARGGFR